MITVYGKQTCSQCRAIASVIQSKFPDCEWVEVDDNIEIPQLAVDGNIVAVGYRECLRWCQYK